MLLSKYPLAKDVHFGNLLTFRLTVNKIFNFRLNKFSCSFQWMQTNSKTILNEHSLNSLSILSEFFLLNRTMCSIKHWNTYIEMINQINHHYHRYRCVHQEFIRIDIGWPCNQYTRINKNNELEMLEWKLSSLPCNSNRIEQTI